MPRVRFIGISCPHCGAEYRVRLERIGGEPFECVSCGDSIDTRAYVDLLKSIHRYSEAVLDLEAVGTLDGETLRPRAQGGPPVY